MNTSVIPATEEAVRPESGAQAVSGLQEIVSILLRHKKIIGGTIAVWLVLSALFYVFFPPIYEADALVQVQAQEKSISQALTDQLSELVGHATLVTAEMQLLSSRLVLGKVFDEMHLDVDIKAKRFPVIGGTVARFRDATDGQLLPPILGMSHLAWGGEQLTFDQIKVPRDYLTETLTVVVGKNDSFELLDPDDKPILKGAVGADAAGVTPYGPISLKIGKLVARPGQKFYVTPNGRAEAITDFLKKFAVSQQGNDSGILQVTLTGSNPIFITEVVNRIVKQYAAQNVGWRASEASQTLEFLNIQLPDFKLKMESAQAALARFKLANKSADLNTETLLLLQQKEAVETGVLALEQQRAQQRQIFQDNHPTIQALNAQIEQANNKRGSIDSKVNQLPGDQKQQLRLQTEVDVSTQLYTALLNEIQQLQVAKAGTVGDVRVVDLAVEPVLPTFPKLWVIAIAAPLIGLLLGCFAAVVMSALTDRVEDALDLERLAGVPVLAEIPFSRTQRGVSSRARRDKKLEELLALEHPHDAASEGIRSLRTALQLNAAGHGTHSMIVTGPRPGVGKTFTAANLAVSLARSSSRVVLIDGDLRRPALQHFFPARLPGFAEWLKGSVPLDALLQQPDKQLNLSYISAGALLDEPAEALAPAKIADLVKQLSAKFDFIIIDTPPVVNVADALVIAKAVDDALVVFQEGAHPPREVRDAISRIVRSNVPICGLVFNQVGRVSRYRYGGPRYAYETQA